KLGLFSIPSSISRLGTIVYVKAPFLPDVTKVLAGSRSQDQAVANNPQRKYFRHKCRAPENSPSPGLRQLTESEIVWDSGKTRDRRRELLDESRPSAAVDGWIGETALAINPSLFCR